MPKRIRPVFVPVALLLMPAAAFAQETEASRAAMEESNLTIPGEAIPPHIMETLVAETGGTELVEREHNPEEGLYLFRTAGEDGERLFLIIRENGDLRTRSREALDGAGGVALGFMPDAARNMVTAAVTETSGRVVEATEDLSHGKVTGFEAEIAYDRDKIRWFSFAPDGSTREVRNETAWNPAEE